MNFKDEVKAVVFDFDGTLIDFEYNASEYTKKALELLKNSNYKVCLSSGRPCFLAKKAFEDVFGEYPLDFIFGCNGAEMLDNNTVEIKVLYPLDVDDVRYIGRVLDNEKLILGIYDEYKFLVNRTINDQGLLRWIGARWLKPTIFDYDSNDVPRSKIIALNAVEDRDFENELLKTVDLSKYDLSYSSPMCLEIMKKGVSKSISIDKLCELLNCSHEQVLAFGDMPNDLPMLLNCSGVAMGNATDEVKSQVKLFTGSVTGEGIYTFLYENELI